jgi:hypothetical protein
VVIIHIIRESVKHNKKELIPRNLFLGKMMAAKLDIAHNVVNT